MIDKKQFGKRIGVLRKKLGLSQADLSEKFNVSTQAVSKWETGLAMPDVDILLEMSWLFEISINSLLEGSDKFTNSYVMTRAKIPEQAENIIKTKNDKQLISSIVPYFTEAEIIEVSKHIANKSLKINIKVEVVDNNAEYEKIITTPIQSLSENCLRELAPVISEGVNDLVGGVDRGLKRISDLMVCPKCREKLQLHSENGGKNTWFQCKNEHRFNVEEGVVYFDTREIPGELWSLWLRNYDHYLEEQTHPGLEIYRRGEVYSQEVKWREIEKSRPRIILDVACGTGSGIKYIMERINWNCIVILCDLSHRILKWNRKYFTENMNNPYIDIVYLACDCTNMPIADNSIDCVTSCGGFESMQDKMMEGFKDANRILKPDANAVYDMAIVDDHNSSNTQKWIELLKTYPDNEDAALFEKMIDIKEWKEKCNKSVVVYLSFKIVVIH